jgi:Golgi nucleoside diphosphatase
VPPKVSLSTVELYGFSEYWFSVEDILSLGGIYDHDKFEEKAKEFCKQNWRTIKVIWGGITIVMGNDRIKITILELKFSLKID